MPCYFLNFLEPTAEIKRGLINSAAVVGEEFSISLELSAVCSGFWSLNGRLLRSGADYLITRSKTIHTLLIRAVTMEMNGAEIKFVGGGSQSSCTLSVKGNYFYYVFYVANAFCQILCEINKLLHLSKKLYF